ncbi:DUF2235 domain-containing protein [Photobacterium sp.]|uniref:T6SS phospholipase effector Tle1-like catalytic domain-containing protein n=1 Tax=Photobacterium sp. TaxID=660 RepID=UPI00299D7556|nr:DUF2235 domain-containing protein [Photobacterium sp.]MDX1304594.1 DUF2235 domain-containing protein [Photobacterium sp.]
MSEHCIPCERAENWIEIDFRDEHNQPYSGIDVTIEDAVGGEQILRLSQGPNLIRNIVSGPVKLTMPTDELIAMVEERTARKEDAPSEVVNYATKEPGFSGVSKQYLNATMGDFWQHPPENPLSEEHNSDQADAVVLCSNESYVIEIRDYSKPEIRFGVFFDGTGNNSFNVAMRMLCEATGITEDKKDVCEKVDDISDSKRGSYDNSTTNIGRLLNIFPFNPQKKLFKIYVEGVGTKSGTEDEMFDLATGMGDRGVVARVEDAIMSIRNIISDKKISQSQSKFVFDIFGFSRGAAAARHFANDVYKKEKGQFYQEAGFDSTVKSEINFIGLFDTVAAIGRYDELLDGSNDKNRGVNLYLPRGIAKKVIQLTALNEYRHNFALNSVKPDHQEITLLGAHSDIGGGYRDGEEHVAIMRPYSRTIRRNESWALGTFNEQAADKITHSKKLYSEYTDSIAQYFPKVQRRPMGGNDNELYIATLDMKRTVNGDLQLVAYYVMRDLAIKFGVPLDQPSETLNSDLNELYQYYKNKIEQNDEGMIPQHLPSKLKDKMMKQYVHCSDNWSPTLVIYPMKPRIKNKERERMIFTHKPQQGYPV